MKNYNQKLEKFDEALGIEYSRGTVLKKDVNFIFENGNSVTSPIISGVRSKKIQKSLFSTNLGVVSEDFKEVKVSPALKMGKKKYSKGYLITTDKGNTLFLPSETKTKIADKWKKHNDRIIHKGDHQTGVMKDALLDGHRLALPPGKRISKNGNVYSEYRKNRSDLYHTSLGDF
jgi:hypothetical protein